MQATALTMLSVILVAGFICQWLAWRIKVPAILPLILIGLLVGDALGVPYDFTKPENIPPLHQIEMEPPAGFRRAHRDTPSGTWSDDGAQALCLPASLLSCGRLDLDDFGIG